MSLLYAGFRFCLHEPILAAGGDVRICCFRRDTLCFGGLWDLLDIVIR
jgi:hypothetical protein